MSTAEQHTLEIDGMHCEHCVAAVRSTLESLEALTVQDVEVGTAEVTYDPAEITTDPRRSHRRRRVRTRAVISCLFSIFLHR